jgi:imidazolonepropionase
MKGIKNLNQIITLAKASEKDGRNLLPEDLGILKNASIVYDDEQILWVGTEVPVDYKNITWADGTGSILLPELVDSHTHLIFAGDRSDEYAMRLNGDSYESIAKSGGEFSPQQLRQMKLTQTTFLTFVVKELKQ